MQIQLSEMGKMELRDACKNAGVKNYGKMTVEGMRVALGALGTTQNQSEVAVIAEARPALVIKGESTKANRVRGVEQNGIKRPLKGVCADVWAACDALLVNGTAPDVAAKLADKRGWNRNNVSIELSRWRKFNGVERSKSA